MRNFFCSIGETLRAKKGVFVGLILLSVLAIVLAVVSAVNLNGSVLPVDLSNIAFIKFLRGECGFLFLIVGSVLNLLIFYFAIVLSCSKKFLFPLAILFYLYFVYCQALIFTSILLIYGLLNALIILVLLLIYLLVAFFVFMLILLCLFEACTCGFGCFFKPSECNLVYLTIILFVATLIFCVLESILKSFVILLVF